MFETPISSTESSPEIDSVCKNLTEQHPDKKVFIDGCVAILKAFDRPNEGELPEFEN